MKAVSGIKKFFSFIGEVKGEASKVVWPGKNEVLLTTAVVFVFAIIMSLYFSIVDTVVFKIIHSIIGR